MAFTIIELHQLLMEKTAVIPPSEKKRKDMTDEEKRKQDYTEGWNNAINAVWEAVRFK